MNTANFDFSGRRVLVTGGTGGIGSAIAGAFRDAGANVAITGTRGSASEYDEDLSGYDYRPLDVEDNDAVDALARDIDRLDVLVNSAGIVLTTMGHDEWEPDNYERMLTMHLTSVFRLSRGLRDTLAASDMAGGASIVSLASMTSYFGIGIIPGYGSAKTGLLGMTRVLAVEWGKLGVRVNALAAGLTRSRLTVQAFEEGSEWLQPTIDRTPLGRLGEPEDIAGAALFLSSDAASWITGQVLPIDGGFTVSG